MIRYMLAAAAGTALFTCPSPAQWAHSDSDPKTATIEDMRVLDPYVGRFRSEDKTFDDSDISYFFVIDYDWYDRNRSILRYQLERHAPALDRVDHIGMGFYYFDRAAEKIGVFGVFPDGRQGAGSMGEFDPDTHARAVWVEAFGPNGQPVEVHDAFELIDADNWRNVTHIRQPGGDWMEINRDSYTRIPESADS